MNKLLRFFSSKKTPPTSFAEKPKLSGGFIGGGSTLTNLKYSHVIPERGYETELKLSEAECKELFFSDAISIPVTRAPCEGYSVFIYRFDEDMGIDKQADEPYTVIWQDSLLLFYCFEDNGTKYVVSQYNAIIGDDVEISRPVAQIIKEFSGDDNEYFDLWSKYITKEYLIDLSNYAIEKKL